MRLGSIGHSHAAVVGRAVHILSLYVDVFTRYRSSPFKGPKGSFTGEGIREPWIYRGHGVTEGGILTDQAPNVDGNEMREVRHRKRTHISLPSASRRAR